MPTETPNTTETGGANRFFDWIRGLDVRREPGWIGGVAAGVAARLGIDPLIVRGIIVVVAILGGPALLLYAAAWLLLPDTNDRIHLERLFKGEFDGAIAGIGVLFLLALLPFSQGFWFAGPWAWGEPFWGFSVGRIIWTLAIIGSIVWLIIWLATRTTTPTTPGRTYVMTSATDASSDAIPSEEAPTPPPTAPPTDPDELAAWKEQQAEWKREHAAWKERQNAYQRERLAEESRIRAAQAAEQRRQWTEEHRRTAANPVVTLIAIGVALIAGAATALILADGAWSVSAAITGMAVTLGILGLAVVINGFSGRRSGGAGGLGVFVAIALVFTSLFGFIGGPVIIDNALQWQPSYTEGDSQRRTVISGDSSIDLSDYFDNARDDDGYVALTVIAGNADVTVPANEHSEVRTRIVAGNVNFQGERSRGGAVISTVEEFEPRDGSNPDRTLVIDVWVIAGNVDVNQAKN